MIIGGSYAGLSAALTLARACRRVLIIDAGKPSNITSPHSHNFLTRDGEKPGKVASEAKKDVLAYATVRFINDLATRVAKQKSGFLISTEKGKVYRGKKILLATGVTDIMPGIAGFADCWGISVLHCPYCHGYETKNKPTAVLADADHAYHLCLLLSNLTKKIRLFSNGRTLLTDDQRRSIEAMNIVIDTRNIRELVHKRGSVERIVFTDGSSEAFAVLFAKVQMKQQTDLCDQLGCALTDAGLLKIDEAHKTTVNGVFAAGDNSHLPRTISLAVASGTKAGFMINWELTVEKAAAQLG